MRINIYIPTKELHESMKAQAGREGKSLSDYLVTIHKEHLGCLGNNKWEDGEVSGVVEEQLEIPSDWKDDFFNPSPKKKK